MKHLFIINPVCTRIKENNGAVIQEINGLMSRYPQIKYDIHITRWIRDALGFCRRYVRDAGGETVRIHTLGGTATHFEIVNAIVDMPNAQMALYPMGKTNIFLHYFGLSNASFFTSIQNQLFADTIKIDAVKCNHHFGISNVLVGFEAYVDNKQKFLINNTSLSSDFCHTLVTFPHLLKNSLKQHYKISLDGQWLDGDYISIMIANQPWYSAGFCPGVDADPHDGIMDIYMLKDSSPYKRIKVVHSYLRGHYKKYPDLLFHYKGKNINISSNKLMWLSVDGETFYGNNIKCEILPDAIDFVYPIRKHEGK